MLESDRRNALNLMRPKNAEPTSEAQVLLENLLQSGLVSPQGLDALPGRERAELAHQSQAKPLLAKLVDFELLTPYQADRIRSGNVQGLVLGNYRVRDRLGVGNEGVVFRGEHRETGQKVAIKVMIPARDHDPKPMLRFFAERKTVAQLRHPGIVRALDVGETASEDPDAQVLHYYVMEHVPGLDLEQLVKKDGPLEPCLACAVAYQVADALAECYIHNLIHRDIKPSNIVLTPDGRAMLLDFGLVRQFRSQQTQVGSLLGVLEWIAPEQAKDAHAVDIRADIYSLGCTLFWCLTAQSPYGEKERTSPPGLHTVLPLPTVRALRGEIEPALEAVVTRMMAVLPDERYPDPRAVMAALVPFLPDGYVTAAHPSPQTVRQSSPPARPIVSSSAHVLIVGDDPVVCRTCREALRIDGIVCAEAGDGELGLQAMVTSRPDLVLLDIDLSGITGLEVLQRLRRPPHDADARIVMLIAADRDIGPLLAAGADGYLIKPIDSAQLRSRVKTTLQLSKIQEAVRSLPPPLPVMLEVRIEAPKEPTSFWKLAINWLLGRKKPNTRL